MGEPERDKGHDKQEKLSMVCWWWSSKARSSLKKLKRKSEVEIVWGS